MFETVAKRLEELGYTVSCFKTAKEAAEYIDSKVDHTTVGIGGSVSVDEMGLGQLLRRHNEVYWHMKETEGMTDAEVRALERTSRIYISSVNGLAQTGEIINIDGRCNRVADIFYGHEKVYLIIGINKLAKDYESALYRARNIAGPLNAKRLGVKTPCAVKADRCYDCKSPERICKGLAVLWGKPIGSDVEVVLVEEKLGY